MKTIFKIIHHPKFKLVFLLVLLFSFYVFISAFSYATQVSSDLQKGVFRLHVIANSDSQEDQNLKYIVRDNLISYMNSICQNCSSKEETIQVVTNHLNDFTNIANQTITNQGFSYQAIVELGNFEFPTKSYGDISFPAGYYDALKVKLGNSNGQNWWCVLYPSLCFIDVSSGVVPDESKQTLKENLNEEEYEIVSTTDSPSLNFKFKLIEFFTENNLLTAKNQ